MAYEAFSLARSIWRLSFTSGLFLFACASRSARYLPQGSIPHMLAIVDEPQTPTLEQEP